MRDVTVDTITDIVIAATAKGVPERHKEISASLIRHLHEFCKEVGLTHQEMIAGCEFLVRAGHISDQARNEFILLADILGVEVLVDMLDHKVTHGETVSTVLGPFYRENPPVLPKGATIVQMDFENSKSLYVEGYVRDTDGKPIDGAILDVWEDAPNGLYEQQDPNQPDYNLRGRFQTDADGHYAFRCLRPEPYPIPYDGAAGELLKYLDRHPWRPGHIHFMVSAPGHQGLISQIYDGDTQYLENDSVFAVKLDLIGKLVPPPQGIDTDLYMAFDFVLKSESYLAAAE